MGELNIHMVSAWIHKNRISMEEYFTWAQANPIERKALQVHTGIEKRHGHVSKWRVHACDAS